jgi:hypothetical protein
VTTLVLDTAVEADAVARLTDMYRGQPVILAITQALAQRWAAYEAVLVELYSEQWIDTADGDLLDALGEIVGESRLGRADDLYRLWIRARIRINRTQGKIIDSYDLVRLIAGRDVTVRYLSTPPAAYGVDVDDTDVDPAELYKLLDAVRPAGVRMRLFYSPDEDTSNLFTLSTWDAFQHGEVDTGLGTVADPDVGGRLRGVL